MKSLLLVLAATLAVGLITGSSASAKAVALPPASFQSTGAFINNWYWLRAPGNTASWTFSIAALQTAKSGSVNLNLSALATNGVNGGSGYSTSLKLSVSNGTRTMLVTVPLLNPFRPIDPMDSGGLGYQVYGHAYLSSSLWKNAQTLTITSVSPSFWRYHVAVNQNALLIGYSIK